MGTVKRIGIADCHGIAEYNEHSSNGLSAYCIRASCNAHKKAVAFELEISQTHDNAVMILLGKKKHHAALELLKKVAINIKPYGANSMSAVYWSQIPNPELDPSFL